MAKYTDSRTNMEQNVGELEVIGESTTTGTRITFKPDPEIFTETTVYDYETINNRLRELSYLK